MHKAFGFAGCIYFLVPLISLAAEKTDSSRPVSLARRYAIRVDLAHYPQTDPQQTIRSIIKATKAKQIEYMLAHLISPKQVDRKFGGSRTKLRAMAVKATKSKSTKMIDSLQAHLKNGTWTIQRNLAWSKVKGQPELSLEKLQGRWFMHNTAVKRPQKLAPSR